jgi:hypothetical protein
MILKCMFEEWFVMAETGFNSVQGVIVGLRELTNEPLV